MNKKHMAKSRNKGKPPICRIVSLAGFQGFIIGRDIGGILKEGHVYQVDEFLDEIVIKDLGEHAVPEWLGKRGRISQYATSAIVYLTKEEYEKEKRRKLI